MYNMPKDKEDGERKREGERKSTSGRERDQRGSRLLCVISRWFWSILPMTKILLYTLFRTVLLSTVLFFDFQVLCKAMLSILTMFFVEILDPQNGFISARTGACSEYQHEPLWREREREREIVWVRGRKSEEETLRENWCTGELQKM